MACLLARRHLPPGERASAYGVVVHLEERQGEVSVSTDIVGEFGFHARNTANSGSK